jgi:hypothetical protein
MLGVLLMARIKQPPLSALKFFRRDNVLLMQARQPLQLSTD